MVSAYNAFAVPQLQQADVFRQQARAQASADLASGVTDLATSLLQINQAINRDRELASVARFKKAEIIERTGRLTALEAARDEKLQAAQSAAFTSAGLSSTGGITQRVQAETSSRSVSRILAQRRTGDRELRLLRRQRKAQKRQRDLAIATAVVGILTGGAGLLVGGALGTTISSVGTLATTGAALSTG